MHLLIISTLLTIIFIAAWQDVNSYRISNILVFSGALLAILINIFLPSGIGFTESILGWGIGLLLLLPLYLFRMMGAGDVKLMAMIGAFVGPNDIFSVFLCTLIVGGVLALIVSWRQGVLRKLLDNLTLMFLLALSTNKPKPLRGNLSLVEEAPVFVGKLPYATAIAAGTMIFLVLKSSRVIRD